MTGAWIALTLAVAPLQTHDMHAMPGMAMPEPAPAPAKPRPSPRKPARGRPARATAPAPAAPAPVAHVPDVCTPEHAAMGHCQPAPPATDADCPPEHAAMGHCTPAAAATATTAPAGTDQPAGNAPAPPPPADRAADAFYDPAVMAAADRAMRTEHGGMRFAQVMVNIAEAQVRSGRDGYRWDGEGWFGGDIHRFVVKTEGEGTRGRPLAQAEVQALYSRTLDPYWNLQAGVRQDIGAIAHRSYATLGIEGLAPYWFEVEAALFLSDRGDVLGRVEAYYDQRVTQRLILQPRAELTVAAQDMPRSDIRAGLASTELDLRLRYEIRREFAPYIGLSWERRRGAPASAALVAGIRAWF